MGFLLFVSPRHVMGKKGTEEAPKILLGRPGNHLKMGIVGLPNVGKSTLFNVLTNMGIPAENFPFCTIDPNESRCAVPDERFDKLCQEFKPAKEIPAYLSITDIAGLVRNAHGGEGLGNAFLSHIRAVDGIFQCLRIFDNEEIVHVEGDVNPIRDLEIIHEELRLKDLETLQTRIQSLAKIADKVDKTKRAELDFLRSLKEYLEAGKDVRTGDWKATEVEWINPLFLLTAKPIVYLVNMSEKDYIRKKNKWLAKIKAWIDEHATGFSIVPFCAEMEQNAASLPDDAAREEYWKSMKAATAVPKIIRTGYHCLHLVHFFTCGADEVRCWTIREGDKAPDAAGTIHTDFQKGFICAEVYSYNDFVEHGSEKAVKDAGKYKQQGKNYVVNDGDIMFIKANTGGGLKKK